MTGTHGYVWDEGKQRFSMALARNASKANMLDIIYNCDDTYTMRFWRYTAERHRIDFKKNIFKVYPEKITEIVEYTEVYGDQLQELFTSVTGLYTHL